MEGGGWQFPSVEDWKLLPQSAWPLHSIEGFLEEYQPVSSTGVCFLGLLMEWGVGSHPQSRSPPPPPRESPGPGRPPSVMGLIPSQTTQKRPPAREREGLIDQKHELQGAWAPVVVAQGPSCPVAHGIFKD